MYGVGPVPALKGLSVDDTPESGKVRRTRFVFRDFVLPMKDDAGVSGHGELKLYTFPEGLIFEKGWVANLTFQKSQIGATNGISDTFNGDFGVGTVTNDGTTPLATTKQDYINTTSTPAATAGATTAKAVGVASAQIDGTAGGKDVWLNILIDDADQDITTNPASLIINGEIAVNWELVGDK